LILADRGAAPKAMPCDNPRLVDPQRKRKIRLVVALSAAVLLSAALIYTSFTAATEAKEPSQLLGAAPGTSYDMTGTVVPGSVRQSGDNLHFRVADREGEGGSESIPVTYSGTIPDPFRGGREIVLTGEVQRGTFVGQRNTLVTKCPSKYTTQPTKNDS
jgi:cytochrome c-type biogenesis protein CcmE